MSFRSKYLKYKIKYLNLKENSGGGDNRISTGVVIADNTNNTATNNTATTDTATDKTDKYDQAKKYLNDKTKKNMLIVGANPDQQDKFNIPEDYKPFYIETDFLGSSSNETMVKENYKNKSFDEYPLLLCDIRDIAKHFPDIKFDIIIFDNGVCSHLKIDVLFIEYLINIKKEDGIIILGGIFNCSTLSDKNLLRDINKKMILLEKFPLHFNIFEKNETSIFYYEWFKRFFSDKRDIKIANNLSLIKTLELDNSQKIILPRIMTQDKIDNLSKLHNYSKQEQKEYNTTINDSEIQKLFDSDTKFILLSKINIYIKKNENIYIYIK
jgi:hypothetical protein